MRILATGPGGAAEDLDPHSEAGRRAKLALARSQILAVGRGDVPAHVVNPDAIARWRRIP